MGTILRGIELFASLSQCWQLFRSTLSINCECKLQIHKIMAGLLDQYTFSGNKVALQMVADMAAYFTKRVDNTIKVNGTEHWHNILNNEFGGMSEVLHNLYGVTQDKEHLRCVIQPVESTCACLAMHSYLRTRFLPKLPMQDNESPLAFIASVQWTSPDQVCSSKSVACVMVRLHLSRMAMQSGQFLV